MSNCSETMYIDGAEISTQEMKSIFNPANIHERVGEISMGTAADVDKAVLAAEKAWNQWKQVSVYDRAKYLSKAADYIAEHVQTLSELLVRENGKVFADAKGDVLGGAGVLRYYSSIADEVVKDTVVENHQGKMILTRQPMGVVSIIVPWNSPIVLAFLMLSPALLAGNCVVIKPSTYCPLTVTKILKELAKMLPPGVLNVVPGPGSTVGDAMVTHPRVRKVSFTGSTEVGANIMRNAASTIKNVSMELGGNDAAVILGDVEVNDKLINEIATGVFTTSGQICYGIKRVYVQREKYREFVDRFVEAASKIRVGFGLDPRATMGPINNRDQYDAVVELIEQTKKSGATVQTVGQLVEGTSPNDGYFVLPTIVTDVEQSHPIVQQEQFGPVIPILPFDTVEEAIEKANDSEFGLGNSVWTNDVEYGFQVARKLQSGSVFVNIHRLGASAVNMPFGGFKQSGIGRGHGIEGLHEYMELQALIHRTDM